MWRLLLLVPLSSAYLIPRQNVERQMVMQPMQPMMSLPSPVQPVPYNQLGGSPMGQGSPSSVGRGCPMSPYATYLSEEQQQTLHELITEARGQGADEPTVKEHIDKYIGEILPPQRFSEFKSANAQFELNRRGKRQADEKQLPRKVFDLLDQYNGVPMNNDYMRFYEDAGTKKLRQLY